MTHPEPRLTTISLSQNSFTGGRSTARVGATMSALLATKAFLSTTCALRLPYGLLRTAGPAWMRTSRVVAAAESKSRVSPRWAIQAPASSLAHLLTQLACLFGPAGVLKPCLFTEAPLLQHLYVSYNSLDSTIPPEIMEATELQQLSAIHAGLRGELPREMMCLKKLSDLHLQRNQLTGTLEQSTDCCEHGWTQDDTEHCCK